MSVDHLADVREGEAPSQAMRHRLLAAVIERLARTTEAFVLRGGLATRAWIAPLPRPTRDLDLVGDFGFDVEDTLRRLQPALACEVDDGVVIDRERLVARGIWLDTAFPGVHVELPIGLGRVDQTIGIDIGFRDPLVPPAVTWAGGVRAVRPETMLGWKLHGLADMREAWRPKDLADLWLLATRVPLEAAALPAAIAAAFESRGMTTGDAARALVAPHWETKAARVRWARARDLELAAVLAELRERLAPVLPGQEELR